MINGMRLLAVVQRFVVHVIMWLLSAGVFAFIGGGLAHRALDIEEGQAMLYVGGPLLVVFSVIYVIWMPASLVRAKALMDEPRSYGPWFR